MPTALSTSSQWPAAGVSETVQPQSDRTVGTTLGQGADVTQFAPAFKQSRRCYFAQNKAFAMKQVIQACRSLQQNGSDQGPAASCSNDLQKNESALQEMGRDLAECPSEVTTAKNFYEATKIAASQGNADAQACYVQSQFQSDGITLKYSQQQINDYLRDAPNYISEGLARGDWRVVSLLARGGHDDSSTLLPLVTKNHAYSQYVMNRLLQLGAEGAYAQDLERSIQASYLSPGITTPPPLTQQQVADGLREAQALYHKSFDHSPLLKGPPSICSGG